MARTVRQTRTGRLETRIGRWQTRIGRRETRKGRYETRTGHERLKVHKREKFFGSDFEFFTIL